MKARRTVTALKVPKFRNSEVQSSERFFREARAMAAVQHPHLCPIHDVGEIDGTPFLTMSFIAGQTLSETMRSRQHFTDREAAALIRTVALAVHAAHDSGIVHRDLKAGQCDDRRERPARRHGLWAGPPVGRS